LQQTTTPGTWVCTRASVPLRKRTSRSAKPISRKVKILFCSSLPRMQPYLCIRIWHISHVGDSKADIKQNIFCTKNSCNISKMLPCISSYFGNILLTVCYDLIHLIQLFSLFLVLSPSQPFYVCTEGGHFQGVCQT